MTAVAEVTALMNGEVAAIAVAALTCTPEVCSAFTDASENANTMKRQTAVLVITLHHSGAPCEVNATGLRTVTADEEWIMHLNTVPWIAGIHGRRCAGGEHPPISGALLREVADSVDVTTATVRRFDAVTGAKHRHGC